MFDVCVWKGCSSMRGYVLEFFAYICSHWVTFTYNLCRCICLYTYMYVFMYLGKDSAQSSGEMGSASTDGVTAVQYIISNSSYIQLNMYKLARTQLLYSGCGSIQSIYIQQLLKMFSKGYV